MLINRPEADVVVVGGGPAGLAAALAMRRKGLRVIVVEREQGPIDKACGEGVMPDGVEALRELGVTSVPEESVPFRGLHFTEGLASAEARFRNGHAVGIRRTTLHRILMGRTQDTGIPVFSGAQISRLRPSGVEVGGSLFRGQWIVGADGGNSVVRRHARLESICAEHSRYGFRQHFEVEPWTDLVEVYWGNRWQIVTTPVARRVMCVALVSDDARLRLKDALVTLPALSRRLNGAIPLTREKGAVSALRVLRKVTVGRIALIGDASGSVDALTGQGLSLAFRQALALAEAISKEDLTTYEAAHRGLMRWPVAVSRMLLLMGRNRPLRRKVLSAFASRPAVFSRLLETHRRAASLPGLLELLGLGWQVFSA